QAPIFGGTGLLRTLLVANVRARRQGDSTPAGERPQAHAGPSAHRDQRRRPWRLERLDEAGTACECREAQAVSQSTKFIAKEISCERYHPVPKARSVSS